MNPTEPLSPPAPPEPDAPPEMSLLARLLNVFAVPGEVFEQVRRARGSIANWLVPALAIGVVGIGIILATFSQPAITQKMREKTAREFDKQVESGKLTRQEADRQLAVVEKIQRISIMVGGSVFSVFAGFCAVFWWALLFWLIGRRLLKADIRFMKAAEVSGLACMIGVLGGVIKMLLVVALSNPMASLSLGMLVRDPEAHGQLFALLSTVDPIVFWLLIVRSIGLGKLAGVPTMRALPWVFGSWVLVTGFFTALAIVAQAVFGKMQ